MYGFCVALESVLLMASLILGAEWRSGSSAAGSVSTKLQYHHSQLLRLVSL